MQLQLAQKMMEKAVNDSLLISSEELRLYIQILEQQNKFAEAAKLLAQPQGEAISGIMDIAEPSGWEMQQTLAELHLKLEEWDAAKAIYEKLLQGEHPDNWAFLLGFFDAALQGMAATCDSTASISALAAELQEAHPRLRGPVLLTLEVAARCFAAGDERALDTLTERVVSYYDKFASKACCASDLRAYLQKTPAAQRPALLEALRAVEGTTAADKAPLEALRRKITLLYVERLLGEAERLDLAASQAKAEALLAQYEASLPLNEGNEPSERGHGDPLLLMAAKYYEDGWRKHSDLSCAALSTALLRKGIAASVHNFDFKVQLMRLLRDLGAITEAHDLFRKLDVKHIQYESLSHELQAALFNNGLLTEGARLAADTCKFHNEAQREIPEYTAAAYRHENYSKIVEFLDFGSKLRNSLTCTEAAACLVIYAHAFRLPGEEPPRVALERLRNVEPSKLMLNEDRHCTQCWEALEEGDATPRWESAVEQCRLKAGMTRLCVSRGLLALLGGDAEALSAAAEQLRSVATEESSPALEAQSRMLDAAVNLGSVVDGSASEEVALGLEDAAAALEAAGERAVAQLQETKLAAEAAVLGVVVPQLSCTAELFQQVVPAMLLLASNFLKAVPVPKGKKKAAENPTVKKFREATLTLIGRSIRAVEALAKEVDALSKALGVYSKEKVASMDNAEMQNVMTSMVTSQRESLKQLQSTAKMLNGLAHSTKN